MGVKREKEAASMRAKAIRAGVHKIHVEDFGADSRRKLEG